MPRRPLALLFLLAALVVVPAGPAWACSCGAPQRTGDLVVVGVAESVDKTRSGEELQVRLRVEVTERGSAGAQVELSTAAQGTACGYEFREGHRYRVYAHESSTSSCDGNEDLGLVDQPAWEPPGALWWALGSGAVVVAGLIWLPRRGRAR